MSTTTASARIEQPGQAQPSSPAPVPAEET